MENRKLSSDELMHYGVLGMKWGHRKKYQTSSGSLNSLGKARKNYEDAKANRKQTLKEQRKKAGLGIGINGIARAQKAQSTYNKSVANEITAKAKYNAAKSKKSKTAEFNTYRKAMQKSGLAGSAADQKSGGRSTAIYNKIKVEKGKAYADRVQKKVQNRAVATFATATVLSIGSAAVAGYLNNRRY